MTEVLVNLEHEVKVDLEEASGSQLPIHLLIVVGQTFGKEEKKTVLERINSSLVSIGDCLVDLKEDLNSAVQSQFDSVKFDQENCIVYNNETTLQVDILINSTGKTLRKAFRAFIQSQSKNKHFICATLDLNSNGDFNLQDSLFSYDNLNALLNEPEAKKSLLNTDNSIKFHLNSKLVDLNKHWKSLEKSHKNIHIVDSQKTPTAPTNTIYTEFLTGLDKLLNEVPINTLMESSDKAPGTLHINKPILYIFPSREGDSAYFTINGYSVLINGGYDRVKPCFWSFVNMLAQVDSVLITHPDSDTLGGLGSFFAKKLIDPEVRPNVLTVLGNLIASSDYTASQSDTAQLAANLIATESLSQQANTTSYVDLIIDSIQRLKITLMPLIKVNDQPIVKHNGTLNNFNKYEHVNLYFKLGQGSLDLYILSPFANSSDYKEFVESQQNHMSKQHQKSHLSPDHLFKSIPMSHVTSAVVLLVWLPHVTKQTALDGENKALRLLFPGNAPQHVVINALDKVKDFEILTSQTYRVKPAPEPIHHSAKKTVTSKPATNGTKPINGTKSMTSTTSKSNLSSKPPMAKVEKTTNGNTATTSDVKSKPKSASSLTSRPSMKSDKKPVSAPTTTAKKAEPSPAKKVDLPKKSESVSKASRQSLAVKQPNTSSSTTSASSSSATNTTNTGATTKLATTTTKPKSASGQVPAKKTMQPNKSASKLNPSVEMTEEEKAANKSARTITKRVDPKQSTSKPGMSNKNPKTDKHLPLVAASTDSVVVSTDLLAASVTSSTEITSSSTVVPEVLVQEQPEALVDIVVPEQEEKRNPETDCFSLHRLSSEVNKSASEWPNLSPVKHDQYEMNTNTLDNHYMEDRNNSIDTSNTSGIDMDTESKERKEINFLISDAKDLIQTPEDENAPSFDQAVNGDLMTKSFIDDGGVDSNPFAASTLAENLAETRKQQAIDDSLNDLNKTHELSDTDGDNTEENQDLDLSKEDPEVVVEPTSENQVEEEKVDENVVEAKMEEILEKEEEKVEEVLKKEEENVVEEKVEEILEEKVEEERVEEIVQENVEEILEQKVEEKKTEDSLQLDDILNGLNTLNLDADNSNNHDESSQNGHQNGHQIDLQNGESSLEDGEIKDEISEKIILKTCQETSISSAVQSEDPAKWNLLELPKPVNPSDLPVPASEKDKKLASPSQDKSKLNNLTRLPTKASHIHPVYLEVSYIPAHGDSAYVDIDFFRKVRSRYYVLSTEEPSEKLLQSIIEAKETWEEKDKLCATTIIPTYESDTLKQWLASNEEALLRLKIDVTPAASMSTLTMNDRMDQTSQLYRLEL